MLVLFTTSFQIINCVIILINNYSPQAEWILLNNARDEVEGITQQNWLRLRRIIVNENQPEDFPIKIYRSGTKSLLDRSNIVKYRTVAQRTNMHNFAYWPKDELSSMMMIFPYLSLIFSRATLLVKIDTQGEKNLVYKPGDHVSIFPANNVSLVESLLGRLHDAPQPDKPINIQTSTEESGEDFTFWNLGETVRFHTVPILWKDERLRDRTLGF